MTFLNMGAKGSWMIENGDETDRMDDALRAQDLLAGKVLSLLQKVVRNYVNIHDDAALDAFQACLGETFRQASDAMQKGVRMEITDNERNDFN